MSHLKFKSLAHGSGVNIWIQAVCSRVLALDYYHSIEHLTGKKNHQNNNCTLLVKSDLCCVRCHSTFINVLQTYSYSMSYTWPYDAYVAGKNF